MAQAFTQEHLDVQAELDRMAETGPPAPGSDRAVREEDELARRRARELLLKAGDPKTLARTMLERYEAQRAWTADVMRAHDEAAVAEPPPAVTQAAVAGAQRVVAEARLADAASRIAPEDVAAWRSVNPQFEGDDAIARRLIAEQRLYPQGIMRADGVPETGLDAFGIEFQRSLGSLTPPLTPGLADFRERSRHLPETAGLAADLGGVAGSLVPSAAAMLIPGVNVAAAGGVIGALHGGSVARGSLDESRLEGIEGGTAVARAIGAGALAILVEQAGFAAAGRLSERGIEELGKRMLLRDWEGARRVLAGAGAGATTEAIEEGLQLIGEQTLDAGLGVQGWDDAYRNIAANLPKAMALGAVGGGVLEGGAIAARGAMQRRLDARPAPQDVQDRLRPRDPPQDAWVGFGDYQRAMSRPQKFLRRVGPAEMNRDEVLDPDFAPYIVEADPEFARAIAGVTDPSRAEWERLGFTARLTRPEREAVVAAVGAALNGQPADPEGAAGINPSQTDTAPEDQGGKTARPVPVVPPEAGDVIPEDEAGIRAALAEALTAMGAKPKGMKAEAWAAEQARLFDRVRVLRDALEAAGGQDAPAAPEAAGAGGVGGAGRTAEAVREEIRGMLQAGLTSPEQLQRVAELNAELEALEAADAAEPSGDADAAGAVPDPGRAEQGPLDGARPGEPQRDVQPAIEGAGGEDARAAAAGAGGDPAPPTPGRGLAVPEQRRRELSKTWSRAGVEQRMVELAEQFSGLIPDGDTLAERASAETGQTVEFTLAVPGKVPQEWIEATEGKPHIRRLVTVDPESRRSFEDFVQGAFGGDYQRAAEWLEATQGGRSDKGLPGLRKIARSWAAATVGQYAPPQAREVFEFYESVLALPGRGVKLDVVEQPAAIPPGSTFKLRGETYEVFRDDDGRLWAAGSKDDSFAPLEALDSLPFDYGSLVLAEPTPEPERVPRAAERPASPPRDLLGNPIFEPATGRQRDLLNVAPDPEPEAATGVGESATDRKIREQYDPEATPTFDTLEDDPFGAADLADPDIDEPGAQAFAPSSARPSNIQPEGTQRRAGRRAVADVEVVRDIARALGVSLVTRKAGFSSKKALGLYYTKPEFVALKEDHGGDMGVMAHEAGHHVDKTKKPYAGATDRERAELAMLDYDKQKKRVDEGFAEFVRHWITAGPEVAKRLAPTFSVRWEAMLKTDRELGRGIARAQRAVRRFREQTLEESGTAKVSPDGRRRRGLQPASEAATDFIANAANTAYRELVDQNEAIRRAQDAVKKRGGRTLPLGDQPLQVIRFFAGTADRHAETALEGGIFKVTGDMEIIGPSLRNVFEGLDAKQRKNLGTYAAARFALELAAKRPEYNPGLTADEAKAIFQAHDSPAMRRAADRLTAMNNALIDVLVDAGVLTPAEGARIKDAYKHYVPLRRVMDNAGPKGRGGGGLASKAVKARSRTGSSRMVLDPVRATVQRAIEVYQRAGEQQVINALYDGIVTQDGGGDWIVVEPPSIVAQAINQEQARRELERMGWAVEPKDPDNPPDDLAPLIAFGPAYKQNLDQGIVRVIRDGEVKALRFVPENVNGQQRPSGILQAIQGMSPDEAKLLGRVLAMSSRMVTKGATGLNPAFATRNAIRDYFTGLVQAKYATGPLEALSPPLMIARYVVSSVSEMMGGDGDPLVRLWQESGGQLSTRYELGRDPRSAARLLRESARSRTPAGRAIELARNPFEALQRAVNVSEVGWRLAEFRAAMAKAGYDGAELRRLRRMGKRPPRAAVVEAINAAHDITTDFRRAGRQGRKANKYVPFLNANIQGNDKYLRTLVAAARGEQKQAIVMLAASAIFALSYALMVGDDDWYEEAPAYLKYGDWVLTNDEGEPIVRIPRPIEYGWLIAGPIQAAAQHFRGKPEWDEYAKGVAERFQLDAMPPTLRGYWETRTNYDTFRERRIVYDGPGAPLPQDQYHPWTTGLAKEIGKLTGYSPAKIEHFLDVNTGGMFSRSLRFGESILAGEYQPENNPILSGLRFRQDPDASVDEFYREQTDVHRRIASAKLAGETPDPEDADLAARLDFAAELMQAIREPTREMKGREQREPYHRATVGLARAALGKVELDLYPNPLRLDADVPAETRAAVEEALARKLYTASNPDRTDPGTTRAMAVVEMADMSRRDAFRLLRAHYRDRGYDIRSDAYARRVARIRAMIRDAEKVETASESRGQQTAAR